MVAESVNDLIRYVRKDEPGTCNVRRMLGRAGVVASDLIPLLLSYRVRQKFCNNHIKSAHSVTFATSLDPLPKLVGGLPADFARAELIAPAFD